MAKLTPRSWDMRSAASPRFIHIGKCGGDTIKIELEKALIIAENSTIHCAQPMEFQGWNQKKYIIAIRNPIHRFVSAFYWIDRHRILPRFCPFDSDVNVLAEALYDGDNLNIETFKTVVLASKDRSNHMVMDIDWCIGDLLEQISAEQIAGVITLENIKEDMQNLFDITVSVHENKGGYDNSLTELAKKNLRKFLATDYACLLKLKDLDLITNEYYNYCMREP